MSFKFISCWVCVATLALSVAVGPSDLAAAKRSPRESRTAEKSKRVELFAALESGEIEVEFIAQDSTTANVMIKNKTDQPLSVQLPSVFAGVPVLAQIGAGGAGASGGGISGSGGGSQGLGGGGRGDVGGGGSGLFRVAPEKVRKIKVPCACLQHGKPDPTPRMKYEIRPIETLTRDERVIELCLMLGRREIPQSAAQAAAWHLANSLSWQQLAAKNRVESRLRNYADRYFSPRELDLAMRIASEATRRSKGGDKRDRDYGFPQRGHEWYSFSRLQR